jgi:hypothetical protein
MLTEHLNDVCSRRGAVLVAACLTAMTVMSVVEWWQSASDVLPGGGATDAALDRFGFPQTRRHVGNSEQEESGGVDNAVLGAFVSILKEARHNVVTTAVTVEDLFRQADEVISEVTKSMEAQEREIKRLERVNARQTPVTAQPNGDDDKERTRRSLERLHSGYLQLFESLIFCEKIIASPLDIKSVSHHERRAWRQRTMGVLHQADTFTLGGVEAQRGKVDALEAKVVKILSKWGHHFRRKDAPLQPETHILDLEEVGYEPVYHGLFAPDAKAHPSEGEGQRLHQLYNSQPQQP